ncbi:MAG: tRNA (adenosine(37)-N6)-threonylcarbamoyltransferase complex dimerization subunit type 1 TsaB [Deltaproteobacteria bacterium]|nr:tRNA (adenosine(37)-N6)-threonylcarbamoyltransferase complex dimerization subunit type 1 TsaB [Deltaproteobacteria bacterium]
MWVLAIETSTAVGTVALRSPQGDVVEIEVTVAGRHGDVVVPAVRDCLARAGVEMRDVGLLAAGIGPGSFTGVRAALGVAKGLALATSLPLLGIGSLDALAAPALRDAPDAQVIALVDARRGEVFAALVSSGSSQRVDPSGGRPEVVGATMARAIDPRSRVVVASETDDAAILGPLLGALAGHDTTVAPTSPPRAGEVARLAIARHAGGERHDPATLVPLYVRPADAKLPVPPRWSTGSTS